MRNASQSIRPVCFERLPPKRERRDPLPLAMHSPASAAAAGDEIPVAELILISEPPPARVLP